MKPIEKNEIYAHLNDFLKNRGIELKSGSYANGIQKGCSLLADAINLSQQGLSRAKVEIDGKLDQMRQAIHEKTAPAAKPKAKKNSPTKPKSTPKPKAKKATKAKMKAAKR